MGRALDAGTAWLPGWRPAEDRPLLLCFPHAGGGSLAFEAWASQLPEATVCPVRLPGRESRFREAQYGTVTELVESFGNGFLDAGGHRQRRLGVFGHSLGAVLAFEFVRWLRAEGALPSGAKLFVSGRAGPRLANHRNSLKDRTTTELVALLRRLGGTPQELLRDEASLKLFLPLLRADFALHESYRYKPGKPLPVPVMAFGGADDERTTPEEMATWRSETSAAFELRVVPGGHFAVFEHERAVTGQIALALK